MPSPARSRASVAGSHATSAIRRTRLGAGLRGYREVTASLFGTPAALAGTPAVLAGTPAATAHGIIGLSAGADGGVEPTVAVAAIQQPL